MEVPGPSHEFPRLQSPKPEHVCGGGGRERETMSAYSLKAL